MTRTLQVSAPGQTAFERFEDLLAFFDAKLLTPDSFYTLTDLIEAGKDAYVYTSVDGRPYVWALDQRWTALEWNAYVQNEVTA